MPDNPYALACPHCGQRFCTLCARYRADLGVHPLRGGQIRAAGRKHWGRMHTGPLPPWLGGPAPLAQETPTYD